MALPERVNTIANRPMFTSACEESYVEQSIGDVSHCRCNDDSTGRPCADDLRRVPNGVRVGKRGSAELMDYRRFQRTGTGTSLDTTVPSPSSP
jgi:hypothetical protein